VVACRPEIDPERLALWGTSFSGGHVLHIARVDPRVRAVVAQVPAVGAWRYLAASASRHLIDERRRQLLAIWSDITPQGRSRTLPITAPAGTPSFMGAAGHDWHVRMAAEHPTFINEMTTSSLPAIYLDDPVAFVESVSPTPVLMILASRDETTPSDVARAVYERLAEPKQLIMYDGDHYAIYDDPDIRDRTIAAAVAFLAHNLGAARVA
jgi:fermentation-respiration switch protein FrsA (DUF1100 family)